MLIRWATDRDLTSWKKLATEVSGLFGHPADMDADPDFLAWASRKISQNEALAAVDYQSGLCMGFIAFSRTRNRVGWLGVTAGRRRQGAGGRLLKTALRQLDPARPVTVDTFPENDGPGAPAKALYRQFGFCEIQTGLRGPHGRIVCRMATDPSGRPPGASFHFRYPDFMREASPGECPVCQGHAAPSGQHDLDINSDCWVVAEYPGQARLFGKMYVMPRRHAFHFEDMPEPEADGFMREVRRVGRALREVTGAVKINYEMHANSGAHLHLHLYPRFLDDDWPGMPIDTRVSVPPPYESYNEFLWFVGRMTEILSF